jgi:protein O-mannosyl-transferase
VISSEDKLWWAKSRAGYTIICLFAVTIAYINSFWGVFQLDDYNVIVFNPAVHSWSGFLKEYFHGIRPLLKLTYLLNWSGPAGIFGFHVVNLGIHLVNTLLVFYLTARFLKDRDAKIPEAPVYPIAFFTAILFGLHPVQTEAVTYISGRSASLMTLFYLGSLAAYAEGSREGNKVLLYLVSPLMFILGMATKEMAVTLPFALVLYELAAKRSGRFKRIIAYQWVHFGLLALIVAIIAMHPRYHLYLLYSFDLRGFKENLAGQINGAGDLLLHVVAPWKLNIDPGAVSPVSWISVQTFLIYLLAAVAFIAAILKKPWITFGIAWFFLNIGTVVLVPRTDIISDRHFYPAGWGLFMVVATSLSPFLCRLKSLRVFIVLVLFFSFILGGYTVARNRVYRSEIALLSDTVAKSPANARAYNNLGYAYFLKGCEDKARDAYLKALEIDPSLEHAQNNLAMLGQAKSPSAACD